MLFKRYSDRTQTSRNCPDGRVPKPVDCIVFGSYVQLHSEVGATGGWSPSGKGALVTC